MHPVQTFPPIFPKIHSNSTFPSTSRSSEWSFTFRFPTKQETENGRSVCVVGMTQDRTVDAWCIAVTTAKFTRECGNTAALYFCFCPSDKTPCCLNPTVAELSEWKVCVRVLPAVVHLITCCILMLSFAQLFSSFSRLPWITIWEWSFHLALWCLYYIRSFNIQDDYKWCERLHKFIGKNRSHHL
jgi:hypothetical protein